MFSIFNLFYFCLVWFCYALNIHLYIARNPSSKLLLHNLLELFDFGSFIVVFLIAILKYNLLSHGQFLYSLQLNKSMLSPTHSFPPLVGAGFVQVRVRVLFPVPQCSEQVLHGDHADQFPSTKVLEHKILKPGFPRLYG